MTVAQYDAETAAALKKIPRQVSIAVRKHCIGSPDQIALPLIPYISVYQESLLVPTGLQKEIRKSSTTLYEVLDSCGRQLEAGGNLKQINDCQPILLAAADRRQICRQCQRQNLRVHRSKVSSTHLHEGDFPCNDAFQKYSDTAHLSKALVMLCLQHWQGDLPDI